MLLDMKISIESVNKRARYLGSKLEKKKNFPRNNCKVLRLDLQTFKRRNVETVEKNNTSKLSRKNTEMSKKGILMVFVYLVFEFSA